LSPADAIARFMTDRNAGYERYARLALAQLVAAFGAFPEFLSQVNVLADTLQLDAGPFLRLPGILPDSSHAGRHERLFQAYLIAGGLACNTRNFRLDASYVDHISDVTASIEVNRIVKDFGVGLDARNWSMSLPDIWEASYEIDPTSPLALNRSRDPQTSALKSPLPWNGRLFEKAVWSLAPLEAAHWRTVLEVSEEDYSDRVTNPFIRFEYRLFECLENEFFGRHSAGGIDVDHGHGDCRPTPLDASWSKLEARKAVRFTQPTLVINDLAFVFIQIWFVSLIFTSACA
jgi:hypothetical protein